MLCIDSHLDLAYSALIFNRDLRQPVAVTRAAEVGLPEQCRGHNTVCFPEMRQGEVFISFSTVLSRYATGERSPLDFRSPEGCYAFGQASIAYYNVLEAEGHLCMLKTAADVQNHLARWERDPDNAPLGHVLSMEGADPILYPDQVFRWWEQGLRILSLVHYGNGHYAHGTNMDGGLFPPAYPLLKNMEQLGLSLDMTHTADKSFWEVLKVFHGRVLATHNNCRALVPHQRQFTDDMIKAIIERDGVIGSALDDWMLLPGWDLDGTPTPELVSLEDVVNHMDHICQIAGNARHVALGTDLDGGFGYEEAPRELNSIADLQKFPPLLRARGYREEDVAAIMHGNWLRFLDETLPQR